MAKQKKSFAEAARTINRVTPDEVEYRKWTVPLRSDQLTALSQAVAHLTVTYGVEFSKAILVRLALDHLLADLEQDPEEVIYQLYRLEQQELAANADRKFSPSKGAEAYLQSTGRL